MSYAVIRRNGTNQALLIGGEFTLRPAIPAAGENRRVYAGDPPSSLVALTTIISDAGVVIPLPVAALTSQQSLQALYVPLQGLAQRFEDSRINRWRQGEIQRGVTVADSFALATWWWLNGWLWNVAQAHEDGQVEVMRTALEFATAEFNLGIFNWYKNARSRPSWILYGQGNPSSQNSLNRTVWRTDTRAEINGSPNPGLLGPYQRQRIGQQVPLTFDYTGLLPLGQQ